MWQGIGVYIINIEIFVNNRPFRHAGRPFRHKILHYASNVIISNSQDAYGAYDYDGFFIDPAVIFGKLKIRIFF